jgi:predicted O-linked N-acetylglucosamine transferase (SPINDLY family)
LARYQLVDLFLDTIPFNGGATLSDALRMGLPVVTCAGRSFPSRLGASLLNALNLPELIGTTQEKYEAIAVDLATNSEKLSKLKQKLISNIPTTLLYNTSLFTNSLEAAYQIMYDRHRNRESSDDIYINNV